MLIRWNNDKRVCSFRINCKNADEDDSDDEETEEQPKLTRKCYEQKQLKPQNEK